MRIETVRITADWLKRSDFGVNHYLSLVPRDAGDPKPPAIPEQEDAGTAIFDETRHPWVADKQDPPIFPCIYITGEGGIEMEGEPTPDGQIRETVAPLVVIARYVTNDADTMRAIRDAEYTLRAILRSLRELVKNTNFAARTRNDICVIQMLDPAIYFPVIEAVGDSRVTGAIGINYQVRDAAPSF